MITALEVLDSAIKIGVGAIISAFVAIWLTKENRKKERAQRKSELLLSILEQVVQYDHSQNLKREMHFKWLSEGWCPTKGGQLSSEQYAEYQELEKRRVDDHRDMKYAEAKLLLLGERKAFNLLRAHKKFVWDRFPKDEELTKETLKKYEDEARKMRHQFYDELHNKF